MFKKISTVCAIIISLQGMSVSCSFQKAITVLSKRNIAYVGAPTMRISPIAPRAWRPFTTRHLGTPRVVVRDNCIERIEYDQETAKNDHQGSDQKTYWRGFGILISYMAFVSSPILLILKAEKDKLKLARQKETEVIRKQIEAMRKKYKAEQEKQQAIAQAVPVNNRAQEPQGDQKEVRELLRPAQERQQEPVAQPVGLVMQPRLMPEETTTLETKFEYRDPSSGSQDMTLQGLIKELRNEYQKDFSQFKIACSKSFEELETWESIDANFLEVNHAFLQRTNTIIAKLNTVYSDKALQKLTPEELTCLDHGISILDDAKKFILTSKECGVKSKRLYYRYLACDSRYSDARLYGDIPRKKSWRRECEGLEYYLGKAFNQWNGPCAALMKNKTLEDILSKINVVKKQRKQ